MLTVMSVAGEVFTDDTADHKVGVNCKKKVSEKKSMKEFFITM